MRHIRARWPEEVVPEDSPVWLFYELDDARDAVTRSVELFADGKTRRNSLAIEERDGRTCSSLWETSVSDGLDGMAFDLIDEGAFEDVWKNGVDTPFWNV